MAWQDKPSKIELWTSDIDYAMFVDENGSESKINAVFKAITNNKEVDDNDRFFTITGCIFEKENYKNAVDYRGDSAYCYFSKKCYKMWQKSIF